MRVRYGLFVPLAGALFLLMPAVRAAAPAKPAHAPVKTSDELLKIPFAPPLDRDLLYDVTAVKFGPKNSKSLSRQSLRFARASKGYTLTVTVLRINADGMELDLTTEAGMNQVPPQLRLFLRPVLVDLDDNGTFLRAQNWPEMKKAISDFPELSSQMEKDPAKRDEARAMMERAMAPFANMTAEQAPRVLLKGWPDLFGLGGAELTPGAEYEGRDEVPSPLLPVNIPIDLRSSLTREVDGALHFRVTSVPDPATVESAVAGYLRSIGQNLSADQKANLEKAVDALKNMKMTSQNDALLDPSTGLVRRATLEKRLSLPGMAERGERTEIVAVQ